jgi:predicted signal transduction protein with EAL and GGDEF domain
VVLQRLGGLLSRHFRGEDLVARWGGEEIALGLYGMSRVDGVAQVASALEALREETFSTPLRVTFSGGVARYGEDGDDLRSLYRAADEVLYRAKALGGNRILPVGWQQNTVGTVDVVVVGNDEKLSELLSEALATRGLRCLKVSDGPAP